MDPQTRQMTARQRSMASLRPDTFLGFGAASIKALFWHVPCATHSMQAFPRHPFTIQFNSARESLSGLALLLLA